jgi:hypothetical protein
MNPFTYFSTDIQQVLCSHLSNKTLSMLMSTSRRMNTLAFGEGIRRHFVTMADYEEEVSNPHVGELTRQGAYLFLARPGIKQLKLVNAAYSRDMDVVLLALETGACDYFEGCAQAARQGDYEISVLLFEKIDKKTIHSPAPFAWGTRRISEFLWDAFEGGNRNLINYFIALESPPDWNSAAKGAFYGGHIDLIEEVFDKYTESITDLIQLACVGRNPIPVIKYLIEKKKIDTNNAPVATAIGARQCELADFLLAEFPRMDTTPAFIRACQEGALDFVRKLMPGSQRQIRKGFKAACKSGQAKVMSELARMIPVDWNKALTCVCKCYGVSKKTLDAVTFCVLKGATDIDGALNILKCVDYKELITGQFKEVLGRLARSVAGGTILLRDYYED